MAKGVYIGVEKKPTLMLLHGDDLTESANNLPVTNNSVTVVDDSGAFGGKALNFSGLGQYLSIADDTLSLPDDFTIDFRLYNAGSTSWRGIFETAGATSSNWTFHKGGLNISLGDGSNLLFAGIAKGGGTYSTLQTPANSVPVGTWSHIALVRSNGVITFYINGVSSASLSDSEAVTTDGTILIGKHDIRDEMYLNGKIDEFRVSSVARWTSNFTPPTEAYSNDEAGVGIARKVKKMYYGVGNLARTVKKGYIGIGGVARPFWTSGPGEPMYYGVLVNAETYGITSPSPSFNSKYAIFVSGSGGYSTSTLAFSEDLVATSLSYPGIEAVNSANFLDFAMFYGGRNTNPYDRTYNSVYSYDSDLVLQQRTSLPTIDLGNALYLASSAKINDSIIISTWDNTRNGHDYGPFAVSYDENFIQSSRTAPRTRYEYCGVQNDNYALFIGGYDFNRRYTSPNITECFDASFVKTTISSASDTAGSCGMRIGDYGCRLGGYSISTITYPRHGDPVNTVDAYDNNLVRSNPMTIDTAVLCPASGIFKGASFIKDNGKIYEIDSDFIKTYYYYTPTGNDFDSISFDGGFAEQLLSPIGDYLLYYMGGGMGGTDQIHAFKFS